MLPLLLLLLLLGATFYYINKPVDRQESSDIAKSTIQPTVQPTFVPTVQPTFAPTVQPTVVSTVTPTNELIISEEILNNSINNAFTNPDIALTSVDLNINNSISALEQDPNSETILTDIDIQINKEIQNSL
jgi:hypothetical protein